MGRRRQSAFPESVESVLYLAQVLISQQFKEKVVQGGKILQPDSACSDKVCASGLFETEEGCGIYFTENGETLVGPTRVKEVLLLSE